MTNAGPYSEVMEFFCYAYKDELTPEDGPDFYIPLDQICGFSRKDEKKTLVYIHGFEEPICAIGKMETLVEVFDMKMKAYV